ncbi:MAG: hypothetical protein QM729_09310 [Solirubrobacterales bacterium]
MLTDRDDDLIRAAFAPARALEPSEADVAAVLARVGPTTRRSNGTAPVIWRRPATVALAALLLLAVALYSVPATRAALEDAGGAVGGAFSGWLGGNSADAPGKPLEADEKMPEYLEYLDDPHQAKEPRVIAEAGGYKLYSYIGPSGGLNFDLGDTGVGMGFESAAELGKAPLYVLGPGAMRHADAEGHVPLFGIAAKEVTAVELTYASGPPLRVEGVEGGFVLLAEPDREPREVLALDAQGEVLDRRPVDEIEWQGYVVPPT